MTEEQYESKRKELEKEIRYQEYRVHDAQMAVAVEVSKLRDLQQELAYLHLEVDEKSAQGN